MSSFREGGLLGGGAELLDKNQHLLIYYLLVQNLPWYKRALGKCITYANSWFYIPPNFLFCAMIQSPPETGLLCTDPRIHASMIDSISKITGLAQPFWRVVSCLIVGLLIQRVRSASAGVRL